MGAALARIWRCYLRLWLTGQHYDAYPSTHSFGGYVFGQDDTGNWNPDDSVLTAKA